MARVATAPRSKPRMALNRAVSGLALVAVAGAALGDSP